MKKLMLTAMVVCMMVSFAMAQDAKAKAGTETLRGIIVDNLIATADNPQGLGDSFAQEHTKACMVMQECIDSGYSLYVDGKRMRFDEASNPKIIRFLKAPGSKLEVVVEVTRVDDKLRLVSIKNQ